MRVSWAVVVGIRMRNLGVVVGVEDRWVGIEGAEEGILEVEAGGADCWCLVLVVVGF